MKSSIKKVLSLVLCIVFLLTVVSACGAPKTSEQVAATTTTAATAEQTTAEQAKFVKELTLNGFDYWGGGEPDPAIDKVSPALEKMLGYKVTMPLAKVGSWDDAEKKIQMWAASGMNDWPHILAPAYTDNMVNLCNSLGKQGYFVDFKPLLDDKLAKIKGIIQAPMSIMMSEGHAYCFPYQWSDLKSYHAVPGTWIREDWLKKVNLPYPKTVDEFENALRAFKANIKDSNGKDIIPFECFGENFLWPGNWFVRDEINVYTSPSDLYSAWIFKDGQAVNLSAEDPATQQSFINALKRFNRWYNDGLIDKECFVIKRGQVDEKVNQGRVGVITHSEYWTVNNYNDGLAKGDPNAMFVGLGNLYDSAVRTTPFGPAPQNLSNYAFYVVRKDAPKEEIDTFIDFLNRAADEDFILTTWFGVKGDQWNLNADGKAEPTAAFSERTKGDYTKEIGEGIKWWYSLSNYDIINKYTPVTAFEKRPDMIKSWDNMGYNYYKTYSRNPNAYIQQGPVEKKLTMGLSDKYKQLVVKAVASKNPDEIDGLVKQLNDEYRAVYDQIKAERTELCKKVDLNLIPEN